MSLIMKKTEMIMPNLNVKELSKDKLSQLDGVSIFGDIGRWFGEHCGCPRAHSIRREVYEREH